MASFNKVANYSGTSVSSVDIDLNNGAWRYLLIGEIFNTSDDGAIIDGYVTDDGFSTVYTTAAYNSATPYASGAPTLAAAGADPVDRLRLVRGIGNAAGEHVNIALEMINFEDSGRRSSLRGRCCGIDSGGYIRMHFHGGWRITAGADNGIRITTDVGNFSHDFQLFEWTA